MTKEIDLINLSKIFFECIYLFHNANLFFILSESFVLMSEIDDYRKTCLKDLAKQITSVMLFAGRSNTNKMCKKGSSYMDKLIEATPCVNQGQKEVNNRINIQE